ncbi:MAG: hypothetical protein WCO79_01680 [bacterium]
MKKHTAVLKVIYFGVSVLVVDILLPIGFNMTWEGVAWMLWSFMVIVAPLFFLAVTSSDLFQACIAIGKPMKASALEPEVVYIVESVTLRPGAANRVSSLAVLKRAIPETSEADRYSDRLFVFFPDKELHEGGQVMGVTAKWFEVFSKSGAASQTTLVLVGSGV